MAIGASVINQNFKEVDSLFLPAYVPDQTQFDQRCLDEFWSEHPTTLNSLTYDGILTPAERATEMAEKFQEFRRNWETHARENDVEYYFVSDTDIFDAEAINQLLHSYCPDEALFRTLHPTNSTTNSIRTLLMSPISSAEY